MKTMRQQRRRQHDQHAGECEWCSTHRMCTVTCERLMAEPLIFRTRGSSTQRVVDRAFRAAGFEPVPFLTLDTRDAVCREVGSFAHGEVLRGPDGEELVVVGVRLDDEGTPQLWSTAPLHHS